MKVCIYFLALIIFFVCLSAAHTQEYGKIRALQQRAAQVTRQKNDFITKVLTAHKIPYERNAQGVIVRIQVDGKWLDVTAIDIVPVLTETSGKKEQLTAHELLFHTVNGTVALLSDLTIR